MAIKTVPFVTSFFVLKHWKKAKALAESHFLWPKHQNRSLYQSHLLELSKEEMFNPLNSAVFMTEVIYQSPSSMLFRTKSNGKSISCLSIIITTCLFSLKAFAKSKIHTDSWLCKAFSTCLKKAEPKCFPLFHSSSFQSKVSYTFWIWSRFEFFK